MSADRMADCTQKLQVTISAADESWQTGFNSCAYRSARSIFSLADGCSTSCNLFNLVPRCPVSRCQSPQFWWSRDVRSRVFSRPVWNSCSAFSISIFKSLWYHWVRTPHSNSVDNVNVTKQMFSHISQECRNHFSTWQSKSNIKFYCWFSPHPLKSCWFLMQYRGKGPKYKW